MKLLQIKLVIQLSIKSYSNKPLKLEEEIDAKILVNQLENQTSNLKLIDHNQVLHGKLRKMMLPMVILQKIIMIAIMLEKDQWAPVKVLNLVTDLKLVPLGKEKMKVQDLKVTMKS